jgi:hypothetical protein
VLSIRTHISSPHLLAASVTTSMLECVTAGAEVRNWYFDVNA